MRIGIDIVTTQNQDAHLGKGNYTLEIVRRLVEMNREDEFFLFEYDAPSTLDKYLMPENSSRKGMAAYKPIYSNVSFVNCGSFWEKSPVMPVALDGLWFNLLFLPKVRAYDLDVYFAPMPFRGIPTRYTKVVSVVHDVLQIPLNLYSERTGIINALKKYEYWFDLNNIAKSEKIITDTEYTRTDLEKYAQIPKNKVDVIYLGVKDDLGPPETPSSRILESYNISGCFMMYLGGVDKSKNVEALLDAFKELITTHPDLPHKLVMVGGGFRAEHPRGKKFIAKAKKLGIEDRVIFTGFVEPEDLHHIYAAADLYVTLSLYEGFGLPAIESMKCGTAVLASDRSCHREVLGEYAVYVNPDDQKEVVEKLYKILTNDDLRSEIEREGHKFVQRYSWDTAAEQTMKTIINTVR